MQDPLHFLANSRAIEHIQFEVTLKATVCPAAAVECQNVLSAGEGEAMEWMEIRR